MSFNQVWLFLLGWAILAYCELRWPLHESKVPKRFRWLQNLLLGCFNLLSFYLILGLPFWVWASWVDYHGWGLLPLLPLPGLLKVVLAFFIFDAAQYGIHRLMHQIPFLWKVHQVHHNDLDVDVSTAIRFHPFEILAVGFLKLILITVLGASRDAVVLYDVLFMLALLWAHSNVFIKSKWDADLKKALVTPSFHQLHHSQNPKSHNGNFGFIFSFWDKLFKTPAKSTREIYFGLHHHPKPKQLKFEYLLKIPFAE